MRTIFYLFFFLLISCELFKLRSPDEPSASRSEFVQPVFPELVSLNIQNALSDGNRENYRKSIGLDGLENSYFFVPAPELQSQIPLIDRVDDVSSFTGLISDLLPNERLTLQWQDLTIINQIDSAEVKADYQLFIPRSSTDYPSFIAGKTILTLKKSSEGLWYVSRWRDFSVSGGYSWSQLKWRFIQ